MIFAIAVVSLTLIYFLVLPRVIAPTVTFKGWYQNGVEVSTAKVNVPVTLQLVVSHGSQIEGTLKVEIREDLKETTDKAIATREYGINLPSGEDTQTVEISFTPTSETKGISMGYFYRLSWNDKLFYDPKDRQSREQLTVSKEAEGLQFSQEFDGWYQSGMKLTSPSTTHPEAQVNVPVTLTIVVSNFGQSDFDGTVKIEIRKDIENADDKSVGFYPTAVTISSDSSTSVSATFTPNEVTSGSLRGYFYKVYVGDFCIYNPTSESGQGPDVRPELKVSKTPPSPVSWVPQGKWEGAGFSGPQITVPKGTTVHAYAHVNNPNPTSITVTIKMEIRRDKISATDNVKATLARTVSVSAGVSFVDMGTFVADETTYSSGSGRLREYFMKVWINGILLHDPTDPATREWVKTT